MGLLRVDERKLHRLVSRAKKAVAFLVGHVPVAEVRFLYEAGQAPGPCPHVDQKVNLSQQNCAANAQALTYQSQGPQQLMKCFDHSWLKSEQLRA